MKRRSWREGRARKKPPPVWRGSLLAYIAGACLVTVAGGAVFAWVDPKWLALVVWIGGLLFFAILAAILETLVVNRRVARLLAEGRVSAARAAVATALLMTEEDKKKRLDQLKRAEPDPLPPYDPSREFPFPAFGLLALTGAAVYSGIAGDPALVVINNALLAAFGAACLDAIVIRAWSRSRVLDLIRAGRTEDATRLAHRREVGTLRDFGFPGLFESEGYRRYRSVIEDLPAAPWVSITVFLVAATSRLSGLPPWLTLTWTLVSFLGTIGVTSMIVRARVWIRLDELAGRKRLEEAEALAERVKTTHGISFEEE